MALNTVKCNHILISLGPKGLTTARTICPPSRNKQPTSIAPSRLVWFSWVMKPRGTNSFIIRRWSWTPRMRNSGSKANWSPCKCVPLPEHAEDRLLDTKVVSSEIAGGKFPEICSNLYGNFRKLVNYLCQSAVSKSSIAKWCCKISMFLKHNSPDLYALTLRIVFKKNNLFLTRLPGISANSTENYRRYNFQPIANISGNFLKISGNIKFPENLQPYLIHSWGWVTWVTWDNDIAVITFTLVNVWALNSD